MIKKQSYHFLFVDRIINSFIIRFLYGFFFNKKASLLFLTFLIACIFAMPSCIAQKPNLAERLGYPKDAKLLIIHADDLGVSHAENQASIDAFKQKMVNSGSIMVPCPWFPEIAAYSNANPKADLGLHLTLTAEWKNYKWHSVAPRTAVPGLINKNGYLYDNCGDVVLNASAAEVEKEIRAQIDRAYAFGVNVSHLDSHMGCLFNPKYIDVYLKVGREYGLPVVLSASRLQRFPGFLEKIKPTDIVIDNVFSIDTREAKLGVAKYYTDMLRNLPAGVSEIIIHAAYDNAEMRAMTINHPYSGASWRQKDFDFFTSDACRKILKEEGIQLITWQELRTLMKK
jgi:predicted glycoside hydrolase/deacetylase ChbG (UPF0249 family)